MRAIRKQTKRLTKDGAIVLMVNCAGSTQILALEVALAF